ncbi:MAG: hypothetical protein Crog4KO_29270 [Crocinitomicaceae bacterium]
MLLVSLIFSLELFLDFSYLQKYEFKFNVFLPNESQPILTKIRLADTMKKFPLIAAFLLISLLMLTSSCKKKLTEFYVDYTSQVIVSSSVGQLVPFSVNTPEMETNSEFVFESNNTRKDNVEQINLEELRLTITSPNGETFSFLNSIEVFISSPNVTERKVAFKESIPSNIGTILVCDLVDVELQEYIKEDRFTLRLKTVTDETIPQDVYIDVYTNFFVKAKLIK